MQGKILAVDDEPDQLELIALLLRQEGFTVDTAANGLEALDQVAGHRPDLIVLDVAMPKMNGFAVCEKLQADPATAPNPHPHAHRVPRPLRRVERHRARRQRLSHQTLQTGGIDRRGPPNIAGIGAGRAAADVRRRIFLSRRWLKVRLLTSAAMRPAPWGGAAPIFPASS